MRGQPPAERRGPLSAVIWTLIVAVALWPRSASAAGGSVTDLTALTDVWTTASCHKNSWQDFKLDISDAIAADYNLVMEVKDTSSNTRTNALTFYSFGSSIPVTRTSPSYNDLAVDNLYSLAINEMSLAAQTYYFSVKCGEEDVSFDIKPVLIQVSLTQGASAHGEVCLNEWIYHKITITQAMLDAAGTGGTHNIDIAVSVDHYDAVVITAEDHHPIQLVPPWSHIQNTDGTVTLQACDVHADHILYVAFVGQEHCTSYNISFTVNMDNTCEELVSMDEDLTKSTHELEIGYFEEAISTPNSYIDYHFVYNTTVYEGNLMIKVVDLQPDFSPEALCVKVWHGTMPSNRESEIRSDFASSEGVYSVALNWYDVKDGNYFVSVLGGPIVRKYKIIVVVVQAPVALGKVVVGSVCPGEFIYHYYDYQPHDATDTVNIQWQMTIHNGNFMYMTTHGHAPLKIVPPYELVDYEIHHDPTASHFVKTIDMCAVKTGKQFLAYAGGDECTQYELTLVQLADTDSCHELEATCVDDCIYMCDRIASDEFINDMCEPGEIKDYMLAVDVSHEHDNLVFEVEDVSAKRNPEALVVRHFYDDLPNDRTDTTLYANYADGFIYSIAISSHDMEAGNHFLSVQCHGVGPVRYRLIARFIQAELEEGSWTEGEVCPKQWIYHTITVDDHGAVLGAAGSSSSTHRRSLLEELGLPALVSGAESQEELSWLRGVANDQHMISRALLDEHEDPDAQYWDVKVSIKMHTGSIYYMTRHGHPPVRISPPYQQTTSVKQLNNHNEPDEFWLCGLETGTHYVGLYGQRDCTNYEITMEVAAKSDNCTEMSYDPSIIEEAMREHFGVIYFGHFKAGECTPDSYSDFVFFVTDDHANENLVIEVEDVTGDTDPRGLEVLLFPGAEMESTRQTEMRSNLATHSGIYSLSINSVALVPGIFVVSVKCLSKPRRFRIIAELIPEAIYDDHSTTHGIVCPGDLIYHSFDTANPNAPAGGATTGGHKRKRALQSASDTGNPNIKYVVKLFDGDAYAMTLSHEPPLRLVPPYIHMTGIEHLASGHGTEFNICNPEDGYHYLALSGGAECANYEVYAVQSATGSECTSVMHCPSGDCSSETPTLYPGVHHLESCAPNQYKDFVIVVDAAHADDNIVVEVEDLEETVDASSLEVSLYQGSIPSDRKTEFFDSFSNTGVWSVAVSSHDIVEGNYYFSVRCAPHVSVNFRILLVEFPSKVVEGHHQHGEVCPGSWVYHHYEVSDSILGTTSTDATSGHRRRERRRRLAASTEQHHLRMEVEIHDGDLYYMLRPNGPPIKFAPPYRYALADETAASGAVTYTAHWCNLESSGAHSYYLGLKGANACASYIVGVEVYTGTCEGQFAHSTTASNAITDAAVKTLQEGHYVYATCSPNSWVDFRFTLTEAAAEDNMAIEVEDLSENVNPSSLLVHLYEGVTSVPQPRASNAKRTTNVARDQVYFIGKDAIEVAAGNYMVGVQCQSAEVRFRAALRSIPVQVVENLVQLGQVSPDAWVFHKVVFTAEDLGTAGSVHVNFEVTVFSGAIYMAASRKNRHPGFAAGLDNDYLGVPANGSSFNVVMCNVGAGTTAYLGLYGGATFASYQVLVTTSEGACAVPAGDLGYTANLQALNM